MASADEATIAALVAGASRGMLEASVNCDPGHVLSAYFTLLRNGIHYVLSMEQSVSEREHNRGEVISTLLKILSEVEGRVN